MILRFTFLAMILCPSLLMCGEIDKRVEEVVCQMTLEEKIDYIGGYNFFSIRAIPRLGVPELKMADGPVGIRNHGPSTSYPAGICLAASWNTSLARREGAMLGYDARARGIHFLLAPAMNIHRSPLCGRNFEYLGEDPYLASRMAVGLIKGIQSKGVIATAKHFAANNQEWDRHTVSSDVDERTLREIYFPAFEASIKEAKVGAIMDSYNLINGIHASEHSLLNNEIVKKEWKFSGIIMSDWDSTYDGIAAANGGLDLEMPSSKFMNRKTLLEAIEKGLVSTKTIDDKVRRILRTAMKFGLFDRSQENLSLLNNKGQQVALETALSGMVLLKNEAVLPLKKERLKTLAVIGPMADGMIPQGGGSSLVAPMTSSSFLSAIIEASDPSTKVLSCRGVPELFKIAQGTRCTTSSLSTTIGFMGEYFDNPDFEGSPSFLRIDPVVSFTWKEGSYRLGGPVHHYSVRWTGYYSPQSTGDHTFYLSASDTFRLFVNDEKVIDNWKGEKDPTQRATKVLEKDKVYKVVIEYSIQYGPQGIEFGIIEGPHAPLDQAREMAKRADAVILCVGFGKEYEGEDWDRSFILPLGQTELIQTVLDENKNVVIVVSAGGCVDMASWVEKTPALLYAWYPGQEGGKALSQILFGEVCPSGKLPVSFERHVSDNPTYQSYYDTNRSKHVAYTEGIFMGYRGFDKSTTKPLFPFGFGLSYTTFAYDALTVDGKGEVEVTCRIKNTGACKGAEVVQLYVKELTPRLERPAKELKGFSKIELKPGEDRAVKFILDKRAFAYYDTHTKQWTVDPGEFAILVGSSSASIHLEQKIKILKCEKDRIDFVRVT